MPSFSLVLIAQEAESTLERALTSGAMAEEILLVDGGSRDRTCEIARAAGARVERRRFDDFGTQRNFALSRARHDWIFSLDADEAISPELQQTLRAWRGRLEPLGPAGYRIDRRSHFLGRWVRHGGWWPDRPVRLFDRRRARWEGQVHERLRLEGPVARLGGHLDHWPYPDRAAQRLRLERYAELWAREQRARGRRGSRLRLALLPGLALAGRYLLRLGLLDGRAGWAIAVAQARHVRDRERRLLRSVG